MRGTMVLVDTSVFVSHFRGRKDELFQELLLNDQIFLSPYVRLELLQGVRKAEIKAVTRVLDALEPLEPIQSIYEESERLIRKAKATGLTFGIIDLLLSAQANLQRCPVYSFDKAFDSFAKQRLVAVL